MYFSKTVLAVAALTPAAYSRILDVALVERADAIKSTQTIVKTITSATPVTINTGIATTGVYTFIPGALTMTFSQVPAYLYLETTVVSTKVSTAYSTITGKATSTSSTKVSSVTASSTSSSAVPTKTGVADCNVQGTANESMTSAIFNKGTAANVVDCMVSCRYTTACISYSFEPKTGACIQYNAWADVTKGSTGVYFSDKYPKDGSDYCYGTVSYY